MNAIDQCQLLLLQSFSALATGYKELEGDLGVFKSLKEALHQLPDLECSLTEKAAALNEQLATSLPTELEKLREREERLKEEWEKIKLRYEEITDDFLLKN